MTGQLQARYIRFQRVTNITHIHFSEIQVFGLDGIELNKSTWTVAMSTVYQNDVGAKLIDGNFTNFAHTLNGANEFIEVDMKSLQTFSHFTLFNRTGTQVLLDKAIGVTVILKDNAGVEIDTPFLVEDIGVYGIVSGSTRRVITSANATYTFRNTALNVYGPANISDSLTVNGSANISGALTAGSANISGVLTGQTITAINATVALNTAKVGIRPNVNNTNRAPFTANNIDLIANTSQGAFIRMRRGGGNPVGLSGLIFSDGDNSIYMYNRVGLQFVRTTNLTQQAGQIDGSVYGLNQQTLMTLDNNGNLNVTGALTGVTSNFSTSVTTPILQGVAEDDYGKIRLFSQPDMYCIGLKI